MTADSHSYDSWQPYCRFIFIFFDKSVQKPFPWWFYHQKSPKGYLVGIVDTEVSESNKQANNQTIK